MSTKLPPNNFQLATLAQQIVDQTSDYEQLVRQMMSFVQHDSQLPIEEAFHLSLIFNQLEQIAGLEQQKEQLVSQWQGAAFLADLNGRIQHANEQFLQQSGSLQDCLQLGISEHEWQQFCQRLLDSPQGSLMQPPKQSLMMPVKHCGYSIRAWFGSS